MKLAVFLTLVTVLQATAGSYAQTITLEARNLPLPKAMERIQAQSGYLFFLKGEELAKMKVNTRINDASLHEAMDVLTKKLGLEWVIKDRTIILRLPEQPPLKRTPTPIIEYVPQERIITGRVVDESGTPLEGATVTVKGTATANTTDVSGNYRITLPDNGNILVFSIVGFETVEQAIGSQNIVNASLRASISDLSEVIIVGYGTQRKSDLTGAVSSIKGDELTKLPAQRVDQALQGQAAGITVQNTDGAPGGNVTIRVRGMNSINGGNEALIVIDGMQGGDLVSLNPNDIASIEILKDASATAIYGSQGANGVILITTKRGKTGKPAFSYDYNYGVQQLARKLEIMGAADYAKTVNAVIATQNGVGIEPKFPFTDDQIRYFEQHGGTDWQDVIYRTAALQNHQLSVNGGTDQMTYLISGGFLDHKGILVNSSYNRYSLRGNLSADIAKWASFGLNWAGSKEAGNVPPHGVTVAFLGNPVNVAPRWAPTEPVFTPDGDYQRHDPGHGASDTWNPLASALEPKMDNNTIRNTINGYLKFDIVEGLSLQVTGGAIINNHHNRNYYKLKTYEGLLNNGYGTISENMFARYQNSNIVNYQKDLEKHRFNITAVVEQQFQVNKSSRVNARDFLIDKTGIDNIGGANFVTNLSDNFKRAINSYLGRINYVFADKYLFTASYRMDGSSVFGKNNKWGYFPSGSVAWRVSEEHLIKSLNLFSDLKLRASWGITGNQAINPYQTLARISSGANYPYNGTESTDLGFYISSAANPSLRWESTAQTNIGADIAVLNGRFSATVDYYKKVTKDLLLHRPLPGYSGYDSVIDNVGSVQNSGLEVELKLDARLGKLSWNTGLNLSTNRNKVLDLGTVNSLSFLTSQGGYGVNQHFMYLKTGEPFGQIYGYGYEGTWKTSEADVAAKYGQLPGDPKFTDINGDFRIDNEDFKIIGNAFPKFVFGWNNSLAYGNFSLSFLIQGTQGNDIFNQSRIRHEDPWGGTSAALLRRWTPQNQQTDIPAFIDDLSREEAALSSTIAITGDNRISRWVEDASYIRLKNIHLSYDLPERIVSRARLNRTSVVFSAMNLITLTNYNGYDPEVSTYTGNDAMFGVDFGNYPTARVFSLGINLAF